ncbi:metalloreductase transmembrane component [Beauveria bassiana ARSEF 2860]|uniref:Metalloreductase transmembrane component n=1 Tax=Beauveria bassiana (strain ARSEF 2860) TaxID=655819 RepID=J4VQJ4_BEAB2|nr:metalloreductase transmembrane component [Beauveria bassiana ARSEF 2860]EJP60955.1 metalloreductase transmembrane component [Beauveria bassiana ARSEF 2860]
MGMRPTTQFQVSKDGYGVHDSDNSYGGDDGGQRERASDIHSAIPPPAAAPAPKQEPVYVKEVMAVRAPIKGNPWAKDRYKKAYTTLDFDGDATVAVGAWRVVLIRPPRKCEASAKGVAQLRGLRVLTRASIIIAHHESAKFIRNICRYPVRCLCFPATMSSACGGLLFRNADMFRRLLRRHSLVGPLYTCKVITYAFVLALHAAVLSLELARTATSAFCVQLTTLADAVARAKYLALLNLTVIYISPHHYGVADVFGVSLQLFRQVHRVAGLLSLCLLLFSVTVALADDPRRALETDEGRFGLMIIACMAALATASLAKTVAYEVFLKVHEISAALLTYLLLSRVLADPSFSRLPLYVYGGVAGLLNVYFICRYGYYNFTGWHRPRLICSEIAASRIHDRRWLYLELVVPRQVHARPEQNDEDVNPAASSFGHDRRRSGEADDRSAPKPEDGAGYSDEAGS